MFVKNVIVPAALLLSSFLASHTCTAMRISANCRHVSEALFSKPAKTLALTLIFYFKPAWNTLGRERPSDCRVDLNQRVYRFTSSVLWNNSVIFDLNSYNKFKPEPYEKAITIL